MYDHSKAMSFLNIILQIEFHPEEEQSPRVLAFTSAVKSSSVFCRVEFVTCGSQNNK
jgi:hypothetical protein